MNNNLDELKRKYEEIEVPQNTLELVEKTIKKAKKKEKALNIFKDFGATLVAIVAILTILVNLNSNIAYGLSKLPILNVVVEVVNFRNYESKHKDMEANLNIPEISVKDEEGKYWKRVLKDKCIHRGVYQ